MNVDSAQCWRTLSNQGTTGNGTDTCLILIIVQEWIQPRFRHGVVTAGHSSFLPTLLRSKLVVETVTRTQSVSHYKRPTLVSPPLTSLRHLRDSFPTFANVRSPPGSQSTSQCLPILLVTLQTVPPVRLCRLTSLSPPALRPHHSSTPPIHSRRSPVFPEFSVPFRLLFPSSGLFPFSTISLSLPSATVLFQCSPSRHYPIPFFPFATLPSRSDSCSTYSSPRYFAHFPCSLFGLPYVRLVFRVPFPHVPLGP